MLVSNLKSVDGSRDHVCSQVKALAISVSKDLSACAICPADLAQLGPFLTEMLVFWMGTS